MDGWGTRSALAGLCLVQMRLLSCGRDGADLSCGDQLLLPAACQLAHPADLSLERVLSSLDRRASGALPAVP